MKNLEHVALVVSDANQIITKYVSTHKPNSGEILTAPLKVGICGTDLQIFQRQRPDSAVILGHEGVARIIEVGSGVTGFSVGQTVVFNPVNPKNQNDILGHSIQGLFQQRLLVDQASVERGLLISLDLSIPPVYGPLVEPIGTVIYGQALVQKILAPNSVAIVGAGPIGLLHALYARAKGCNQVFLIHPSRARLDWAIQRNIVNHGETFLDSPQLSNSILDATNGNGVDAVYLCTTRSSALKALKQSLSYLRDGGCLDLVGGFSDGDSIPDLPCMDLNQIRRANFCGSPQSGVINRYYTSTGKVIWLTGHRGTSREHLLSAMQLLYEQPIKFASVISHIVPLKFVPLVLEHLKTSNIRQIEGREWVKVIVDLTEESELIQHFELT